jgi:hypothetical protein
MTAHFMQPAMPTTTAEKTPEDRRTEFVPVQGGTAPTTNAETLVVSAYMVMWVLLLYFIWLGWRRAGRIETRVGVLERALEKRDGEKAD